MSALSGDLVNLIVQHRNQDVQRYGSENWKILIITSKEKKAYIFRRRVTDFSSCQW